MKGWEWMLLLILFWILLPLYSWKRQQIYEENLGYGNYQESDPTLSKSTVWTGVKLVGGLLIGVIIFIAFISIVLGPYEADKVTGQTIGDTYSNVKHSVTTPSISPTHSITFVPTVNPVITQTQASITLGERNAARKAKDYLNVLHFSREGLIKQLEGFEGFSHAEATYGVDQTGADWNEQAAGKAKDYLDIMAFSRDALIKQLVDFEGYTHSQAEYGAQAVGY